MFKRSEIKKLFVFEFIFILIFVCIFTIILVNQYNTYVNIVNNTISNIFNNVVATYPNVNEEDLIKIINSKSFDNNALYKFGYDNNFNYIYELKNSMLYGFFVECLFVIIFGIASFLVILFYKKKEYKNIDELNKYFYDLNNKDYELKISQNTDDEFSKLRNELYKTTILLKQTAENTQNEKVNLSNALTDISHQLKTPITSIRILFDNICDNPNMDDTTKREFLYDINKQIDWISSLVVSLLKLAKIDSGVICFNNDSICVKSLINDIISGLAILLDLKNIQVVTNISDNIVFYADYKWQYEALTNIIKNCIEHSYDGSKIFIDVFSSSVFTKIIIKDFGCGIAREDLNHIFERFYKCKNSSPDSVGIGLALSKSIIEKANGYITVSSEVGKGTTFEIKYLKT